MNTNIIHKITVHMAKKLNTSSTVMVLDMVPSNLDILVDSKTPYVNAVVELDIRSTVIVKKITKYFDHTGISINTYRSTVIICTIIQIVANYTMSNASHRY